MDYLRQGIGLRGYAQKNPKQEYKLESYKMFTTMLENFKFHVIRYLSCVQIRLKEEVDEMEQKRAEQARIAEERRKQQAQAEAKSLEMQNNGQVERARISRNAPCPCGSGKKYKSCCGKL
jgi:preprotein translocase subunit SecA